MIQRIVSMLTEEPVCEISLGFKSSFLDIENKGDLFVSCIKTALYCT
jgi:hypothetical protein